MSDKATDDLDRRIDARIARALRMIVVESNKMWGTGNTGGEVNNRVADSLDPPEPSLKPCPFCGTKPSRISGIQVACCNMDCTMEGWHTIENWNRREVPHGQ